TALQVGLALAGVLCLREALALLGGALASLGGLAHLLLRRGALLLAPLLFRGSLLRDTTLFGHGGFGLLALLLATRQLLGRRRRRTERLLRRRWLLRRGRFRACGGPRLRRRAHRASQRARIHHRRLDRECRFRRWPPEQHPSVHQRGQQRSMQQHRQRNRYPAVTRSLHRSRASAPAARPLGQRIGDETDLA